jgi:high-affinity iron transporter
MIQISLVIFRELLEIFLLIGIIASASSNKIKYPRLYIAIGSFFGMLGAGALALFTPYITNMLAGLGQEIVNASIVLFTAVLLGLTAIAMPNYSTNIKTQMNEASRTADQNLWQAVCFITLIAATIFREGAEVVLFAYSKALDSNTSLSTYLFGAIAGSLAAGLCGFLFYKGLLKIGKIFKITSFIFIIVASGLASEAVRILSKSGIISILNQDAWDISWLITNESILGYLLKILISYDAKPSVLEVIVFISTFAIIYTFSRIAKQKHIVKKI